MNGIIFVVLAIAAIWLLMKNHLQAAALVALIAIVKVLP